jgi:hypothetical protein
MYKCPHCVLKSYESKLSLSNHRRRCEFNPNRSTFKGKNPAIKAKERGELFQQFIHAIPRRARAELSIWQEIP